MELYHNGTEKVAKVLGFKKKCGMQGDLKGVRESGDSLSSRDNPGRSYPWEAAACGQSSQTNQQDECQGSWH